MAATNYTPIQLYNSGTASTAPTNTNLAAGELALNYKDGLLYYKDDANVVQKIGYKLVPIANGGTGATTLDALAKSGANSDITKLSAISLGTALLPSYSFTGDANTGAWSPAADTWAVSTGGSERIRASSTGLAVTGALSASGTGAANVLTQASAGSATYYVFDNTVDAGGKRWRFGYTGAAGTTVSDFSIYNQTDSTTAAVFSSTGNLGIGVSPSDWYPSWKSLDIVSGGASFYGSLAFGGFATNTYIDSAAAWRYKASYASGRYEISSDGAHRWYTAPTGTAGNVVSFTNTMTLDASGNLLVGQTSSDAKIAVTYPGGGSLNGIRLNTTNAGTSTAVQFVYNGSTQTGSISCTTTATTYGTGSDHRLKNITGPVTDSGSYIDSLRPVQGSWKADGSAFVGFLAHEVQEVSRTPVATGEKDGDEMQTLGYSSGELIANMVAELKSLRSRIAQLESKA